MYSNESKGEKYPAMADRVSYEVRDLNPMDPTLPHDYQNYMEPAGGICAHANPFEPTDADASITEDSGRWLNQMVLANTGQKQWDACAFSPESYIYLGWGFDDRPGANYLASGADSNSAAATAANLVPSYINFDFVNAFVQRVAEVSFGANTNDSDIALAGGGRVLRLREGIERFYITDINNAGASAKAQSQLAIMYDFISAVPAEFNHIPGGSNVLYMDGHVEFNKYGGTFPVTRVWALFSSLF
jgi:prepilin-type processing-associated H-X9-DG protein